jgi:hypothetical protein
MLLNLVSVSVFMVQLMKHLQVVPVELSSGVAARHG